MWSLSLCIDANKPLFELQKNKDLKILESYGLRFYPQILNEKFTYYNTKYSTFLPKLKLFPKKFADIQRLFFKDSCFDFVIASDIFEHVKLDDKAFSEVFRVLKPNGCMLMTIPFDYSITQTDEKIKIINNKEVFLSKPEYHNDGIKDGGDSLSYRMYGKSLFKKLTNIGFNVDYLNVQIPKYAISKMELFFCRKNNISILDKLSEDLQVFKKETFVKT